MTPTRSFQPLTLAQSGTLLFLLILLFLFARGPYLVYGGASFCLLAAYHVLTDHRFGTEQIRAAGLLIPHIGIYLLICTIVIWTTTGESESPYWVIYMLPIAAAASSMGLRGVLTTCAAASLLFLSQVPAEMYLDPKERHEEIPELMMFFIALFIVGVLIQAIVAQNRRQLEVQKGLNEKLLANQQALQESLARLEAAEESLRRKERLAALGEMSAGLAHEIRNPLGIVSSSAQLLGRKINQPPAGVGELLDIIQEETARLNGLVSDFLSFGRPAPPNRRRCDLQAEVLRAVEHVRGVAEQKGIVLAGPEPTAPQQASVDPEQLQQVLLNLLLNAIDATPAGGRVEARVSRLEGAACIEIRDTGCGIPAEIRSQIFDPFFTTKEKGTGLGLANASRIVDSHGGELKVDSTPDAGSVFFVILPLEA
ncbi:sensor histidine kinase [Desulfuromonas versatilis]|uniref:histidine kinase n=1 Tax=Desulfuromonas versatilis TaxID=2802975 RepID=A0ABM8HZU6_9BACT|nr:ATP-binding protein [Desulfuromonas versatilis]BCR06355.1 sensor histidine kinase [Desulfuromonas versatilis]